MKRRIPSLLVEAGMVVLAVGCKPDAGQSGQSATSTASSQSTAADTEIAKIVFIGKKDACDCTRQRVDDSLAALQTALGPRSDITTERLQADVDAQEVARYQTLRPIVVLPAIYFLGGSGALVEVLQGEVTVEQVQRAMGG